MAARWLIHDTLFASAGAHPSKLALVGVDRKLNYESMLLAARGLARAFQELGLRTGDRVLLFLENSWPSAVAVYATWIAGGVVMVVNPQTKVGKLRYLLLDSEARLAVVEGRLAGTLNRAASEHDGLVSVVVVGEVEQHAKSPNWVDFDTAAFGTPPNPKAVDTISVDLAALIYTSGSTGEPKAVMMTHQNVLFTAESVIESLQLQHSDVIFNVLPMSFSYGLYQLLMAMKISATLVLEKSFAFPLNITTRIANEGATVFPGVPTMFSTLLGLHRSIGLVLPTLRSVTNAAAALPIEWLPEIRRMFPSALFFSMYGLTECKRVSCLDPCELDRRPGSVGKAIPGTQVLLLAANGCKVAPGEPGILHVRGAHVMTGYWRDAELTSRTIKAGNFLGDRLLCTNDVFVQDEEGYLYFLGRSDEMIKVGGQKVSPIEVENALYAIAEVREAAVIGVANDGQGQFICAFVALQAGSALTEERIRHECHSRLESNLVPSRVIFLDTLPKTPTGKIRKQELYSLAEHDLQVRRRD